MEKVVPVSAGQERDRDQIFFEQDQHQKWVVPLMSSLNSLIFFFLIMLFIRDIQLFFVVFSTILQGR
jgi:hypothetical protein